jgi:hypothetical protein
MLLVFLGENRNKVYYGTVKEFSNGLGMISQCLNVKNQQDKAQQKPIICGNVMKQILNKYGFLCWKANVGRIAPSLGGKVVMLVGIDVYHAKMRFVERSDVYVQRRSVGAFVAVLINVNTGDYITSNQVVEVKARTELLCKAESDSDTSSVQSTGTAKGDPLLEQPPTITSSDALMKFIERSMKEHGVTPDHIIVYRDGVCDSMLNAVAQTEVKQVQNACKTAKLIFSVCQKRIHTRFFVQGNDQPPWGNPPAGTVIHDGVSSDKEFFLIPTKCTLSTVRPVRYILLHNDGAVPLQEFQSLTYAMGHVYPNWPDAITCPFVTQLAHKLAFQMGECVQNTTVNPLLHKSYFYL